MVKKKTKAIKPVKKKAGKKTTAVLSKKGHRVHRHAQAKLHGKSLKLGFFLGKFFLIFIILTTIVDILDLSLFTNWLASISAIPLGLLVVGSVVFVGDQQFFVSNACTGLVSASILAAVIFSLKKPILEEKIVIFFTGLIILLIANIPRLMLVLWTAIIGADANFVHVLTWFLMSALILLIWYFGTKRFSGIQNFSELL